MEEESVRKLYREYLENALDLKYKRMVIERESLKIDAKFYLKIQNDNNPYAYEKFDNLVELENGNYLGSKGNTYVFFSSDGTELNRYEKVKIERFHNGYARIISTVKPNLCGFINMDGKLISEMKWGSRCRDFECGRALVNGSEGKSLGKHGYIDEQGNLVIPFISINGYSFSDDVCCVENGGKKYYYDKDGNELFSDAFTGPFFHNGLVTYEGTNGKYGYKNKKGEVAIKPKFERVSPFENGLAKTNKGYINIQGEVVRVSKFEDGVNYIKGILKTVYYNDKHSTYDKMECIPYMDLGDYLICIKDSQYVIYSKETRVYTPTGIIHVSNGLSMRRKDNLLEINNIVFRLNPSGCTHLSNVLDVENISSSTDEEVMEYDTFASKVRNDKNYYERLIKETQDNKKRRVKEKINNAKMDEDIKRQEIIAKLTSLKAALTKLDKSAGELSKIDHEILFSKVDDHYEINEEFINQLRFLDLSYIDFTNVKVSGLDFSGSNASINPQLVYKKDMSYGKYDGLSFISSDFNMVNITGASFEGCIMDFAQMSGAIDEGEKNK